MRIFIGERLKDILADKGMMQKTLADRLGMNKVIINDWCRDLYAPTTTSCIRLAKELGVSLDFLLTGKEFLPEKTYIDILTDINREVYEFMVENNGEKPKAIYISKNAYEKLKEDSLRILNHQDLKNATLFGMQIKICDSIENGFCVV